MIVSQYCYQLFVATRDGIFRISNLPNPGNFEDDSGGLTGLFSPEIFPAKSAVKIR